MHRAIRISSVLLAITVILTCATFFVEASESPPVSDLLLSDDWLLPNSSKKLSLLNEMTGEAVNEDNFVWMSSNPAFSVSPAGVITSPESGGSTLLTVTHIATRVQKVFRITSGIIPEGTYMIENPTTGYYMSAGSSPNTYIEQVECHSENYGKWNIIIHQNGDYIFQSADSYKYLRVENGSTSSGAKLVLNDDANWTSTRWSISLTASGHYRITPMLVSSFAVSVPLISLNGSDLVQKAYTNDSNYKDEWNFFKVGIDALLLGIKDSGHNHHSFVADIIPSLSTLNYSTYNIVCTNSISKASVRTKMAQSSIYISRSHGNYDENGTYILLATNGASWLHTLDLFDTSSSMAMVNLSNCDLMLFVACYTARDFYSSIVWAAVQAGADCALGFTDSITCSTANLWVNYFFERYELGYTVSASAQYATSMCDYEGNLDTWIAYG